VGHRLVTNEQLTDAANLPDIGVLHGQLLASLRAASGTRTRDLLQSHQRALVTNLHQLQKGKTTGGSPQQKEGDS